MIARVTTSRSVADRRACAARSPSARLGATERAQVRGGQIGRSGAGIAQACDHRSEQPWRRGVGRLDLKFAEAADNSPAVEHGDGVTDDIRYRPSLAVLQQDPAAKRAQAGLGMQVGVAG